MSPNDGIKYNIRGVIILKNKLILKYSANLFLIILLITVVIFLLRNYELQVQSSLEHNYLYLNFLIFICFGAIGFLLGLFNSLISLKGNLKINKISLFILGIPSFILSLPYVWVTLLFSLNINIVNINMIEIRYVAIIFSIIFGHTLIQSLEVTK